VLVGDRFSGALAEGETLTLTRTNGSVADEVTFGGGAWPQATGGETLSLNDVAADNNDPANWSLSARPGGTPSAANNSADSAVVPGAPQLRSIAPGDGQVTVVWRAPYTDGGAAITSYQVQARDSGGQPLGAPVTVTGAVRTATVTGLTNGQAVTAVVTAVNRVGIGANSNVSASSTPTAGLTAPSAPGISSPLAGTAGGELTLRARWTASTTTGGTPITGYRAWAYRMSSNAADAMVLEIIPGAVVSASTRSFDFKLQQGWYRFQVEAINAVGTSARSAKSAAGQPQ
jgi:hypothetical protein